MSVMPRQPERMPGNERRGAMFDFIDSFIKQHGYAPTVREIGEGVGLHSSSTVFAHLRMLRGQGCLTFEDNKPRTIRIIESPEVVS